MEGKQIKFGGKISLGAFAGDPPSTVDGDIWYNSVLGRHRKKENGVITTIPNITSGTANPSGGNDGDIYLQYT